MSMVEVKKERAWMKLSAKEVKGIFVYYCLLMIISLPYTWRIITEFSKMNADEIGLTELVKVAFSTGFLSSTCYYIRKLYKACIQKIVSEDGDNRIESIGLKVYFYFRPLMGAILAAFVALGIYSGFFVFQSSPSMDAERVWIFIALISFVVGFSNGKLIDELDKNASKFAKIIAMNKGKDE